MLKTRVLTAAILIPLLVLGVLELPAAYFSLVVGLVIMGGGWEWTRLCGCADTRQRLYFLAVTGGLMAAGYYYRQQVLTPVLVLSCLAWLVVAVLLWQRRALAPLEWPAPARWVSGLFILLPAWLGVCLLQENEPWTALLLFVLVWSADSAAYFTGRGFGRRKLAPAISPGKTLEGVAGALASVVPVIAVFSLLPAFAPASWPALLVVAVLAILMSVVGDLFESNWKRLTHIKDSGGLLPGHGGVLDRIDGLIFAAPLFLLYVMIWL